jgi:2-methylcitrate dehydratase PrpD
VTKPYIIREDTTVDSLFNHRFTVATALVRKKVKSENFTEENIRDREVQSLIGRINLADLNKPHGAQLELKMKDGRTLTMYIPTTKGVPDNPMSRDEMIEKFMEQVEFTKILSKENAAEIIQLVENLEDVDNINQIAKLAVKKSS